MPASLTPPPTHQPTGLDDEPSSLVSQLAAQGLIENAFSLCFDTDGQHLLVLGHVRDADGQLMEATVGGWVFVLGHCTACMPAQRCCGTTPDPVFLLLALPPAPGPQSVPLLFRGNDTVHKLPL